MNIRDNLLVTMGARAAYMECLGAIELPTGVSGEDDIARFVAETVDRYIDEENDESFDLYIEHELLKKYPMK